MKIIGATSPPYVSWAASGETQTRLIYEAPRLYNRSPLTNVHTRTALWSDFFIYYKISAVLPFLKIGHTITVFRSLGICSLTHTIPINFRIAECGLAIFCSSDLMLSSPGALLSFRKSMIARCSSIFCSNIFGCTVSCIVCYIHILSLLHTTRLLFSNCSKCSLKSFIIIACVPVIRFPSSLDIAQFRGLYPSLNNDLRFAWKKINRFIMFNVLNSILFCLSLLASYFTVGQVPCLFIGLYIFPPLHIFVTFVICRLDISIYIYICKQFSKSVFRFRADYSNYIRCWAI